MTPHASPFTAMPLAREPEPLPVGARLDPPDSSTAAPGEARRRPLEVAQCSLCGIALPQGLLVPDGGDACADLRWYCKDARSCTERWTTARRPSPAYLTPAPGHAFTGAAEPAPAEAPAEPLGGLPDQAQSVA
jgi:hypothetical protein